MLSRHAVAPGRSSSSGEFHPEALTDPYVTLSRHTALHGSACLLREQALSGGKGSSWFPSWPCPPSSHVILFAPRPLQTLQRYYRMIRHLQVHRYFPFVGRTYRFSLSIHLKTSHVPSNRLLGKLRPPLMPDAASPVNRFRRSLSRGHNQTAVLTSSNRFRHFNGGSPCGPLLA